MLMLFVISQNAVKVLNSLQSITSKLIQHPGKEKLGQVKIFLNR